jgi:hypothetical protein
LCCCVSDTEKDLYIKLVEDKVSINYKQFENKTSILSLEGLSSRLNFKTSDAVKIYKVLISITFMNNKIQLMNLKMCDY